MRILCALGKFHYGNPNLGVGTEYAAFTAGFRSLGHTIEHFEPDDVSGFNDYAKLNSALLESAVRSQPEIVFTVQRDYEFWAETLDAIAARTGARLVTWTTDDSFKFKDVSRHIAKSYDLITTTYRRAVPKYHSSGIRHVLSTQWAANPDRLLAPRRARECEFDVTFVGAAHGNRPKIIQHLKNRGISVRCFGQGWDAGPVTSNEVHRIMNASFISLNFANSFAGEDQLKMRTFEIPGAGSLLLTGKVEDLNLYYTDQAEILTFSGAEHAVSLIERLRRNPDQRDDICLAGFLRTAKEHTFSERMKAVLDAVALLPSRIAPHSRVDAFELAMQKHTMNSFLKTGRRCLTTAATLLMGSNRGVRAARRFAFLASLTFCREKTFTASGLPGRLYPFP